MFEVEELDEAYETFESLAVAAAFENDATRATAATVRGYRTREFDIIVNSRSRESTVEDRRSLVSVSMNHDQMLAVDRLIFEGGGTFTRHVVATRGNRLTLEGWDLTIEAQAAEASVLTLVTVDDDGRQSQAVLFDPDNHDAALAELDRQYLAGEGRHHAPIIQQLAAHRIEHLRIEEHAGICVTLDDQRAVLVFAVDEDQAQNVERFSADGLDEAIARFEQLKTPEDGAAAAP